MFDKTFKDYPFDEKYALEFNLEEYPLKLLLDSLELAYRTVKDSEELLGQTDKTVLMSDNIKYIRDMVRQQVFEKYRIDIDDPDVWSLKERN